jgi:DUF917 family protein
MMSLQSLEDVQDLARGAVLLGTGGGGDPYVGELFLSAQLEKGKKVEIVPAEALPDDAFVISIAGIGSPPVLLEHLVSERTLTHLIARAEAFYGRRIDAIISAEIGGANAMFPLALGALIGIPVVDADGIGRAVPHIEMTTFSIFGCKATPALLVDDLGNCVTIDAADDRTCENIARATTMSLGSITFGALYPMTGQQVKRCAVHRTLTHALEIGRCIRNARAGSEDVVGDLVSFLGRWDNRPASILFDGKIVDVRHETRDGWHWGQAILAPFGESEDRFSIDIQNEYLVARMNDQVVAMVPDLITIVDRESGEPLTAEMLTYGLRVKVIGYAADPLLRRPESLDVLGPRMFGLDMDYEPIETLNAITAGEPVAKKRATKA